MAKDAEYGRQEAHLFVNKLVQLYGKYLLSKEIAMESFFEITQYKYNIHTYEIQALDKDLKTEE